MACIALSFLAITILCGAGSASGAEHVTATNEQVLIESGIGPNWIDWDSPALPNADLVYVDNDVMEICTMDEHGNSIKYLTTKNNNILGVNFPLDEDGRAPLIHWKGDPEAIPNAPIIFFKAENENSDHVFRRNSPSIGWENDLWALNVETKEYTRLTNLPPGHGLQHSAVSHDGVWYVYPHRYDMGQPIKNFGYGRMVFSRIQVDANGGVELVREFDVQPNGPMYYEPIDIYPNADGSYSLLYVAGNNWILDPYRFDWTPGADISTAINTRLQQTPLLHEEFTTFSPDGTKIIWMRGPLYGLKFQADLYISNPDFTDVQRLTFHNQNADGTPVPTDQGAQLSRLTWNDDGTAIFYGLWQHKGPLRPFAEMDLRRLDLEPAAASQDDANQSDPAMAAQDLTPPAGDLNDTAQEGVTRPYSGTYTATNPMVEKGTWSVTIDEAGVIVGSAYSEVYGMEYHLVGRLAADGTVTLTAGNVDTGAVFTGILNASGNLRGEWHNPHLGPQFVGTFTGGPAK